MSTTPSEGSFFVSSFDGTKLFVRQWSVPNPTAAVFVSHGMSEHSKRYVDLGVHISKALNANVFSIDHRAHGLTACPAGECDVSSLGVFGTSKDKSTLNCLEVMGGDLLQLVKESSGDLPIILFGHSMGSLVARWCLKLAPADITARMKGVVLSGIPTVPAVFERFPLFLLVSSAIRLGRGQDFLHNFIMGKFDAAIRSQTGNKQLPKNSFISSNSAEVDAFLKDPLCGQTIDLHIWKSVRSTLIALESPASFYESLENHRVPILFISGKNDPVCRNGQTAVRCAKQMRKIGFEVTEEFLDNCLHEFLHELPEIRMKGLDITAAWIRSKL
jgi:alpha-beta hydrolase superfamily lysophospholipase